MFVSVEVDIDSIVWLDFLRASKKQCCENADVCNGIFLRLLLLYEECHEDIHRVVLEDWL